MRRLALVLAIAALVTVGAACSDDGNGGTDGSGPAVSFGSGSVPETIPADFPIPPGAIIGSTLVDKTNNRTEVELRLRQDQATTIQYFTVNLVNQGYVIDDSSERSTGRWVVDFRRNELQGSVQITEPTPGASQVIVDLDVS